MTSSPNCPPQRMSPSPLPVHSFVSTRHYLVVSGHQAITLAGNPLGVSQFLLLYPYFLSSNAPPMKNLQLWKSSLSRRPRTEAISLRSPSNALNQNYSLFSVSSWPFSSPAAPSHPQCLSRALSRIRAQPTSVELDSTYPYHIPLNISR